MRGIACMGRHRRDLRERERAARDVGGIVGDALEVGGDLEGRNDGAQVERHRLAQGDQHRRPLVDLVVHVVDLLVGGDDHLGEVGVAAGQGLDRARDLGPR